MLRRGCLHFLRIYILGLSFFCGVMAQSGTAQVTTAITPDGRLGTEITQSGDTYEITGGTRPQGGGNLFHGFDRFHVGTDDTAHFAGAPGIENIIGRVTGGERSEIDGRLSSDATLFLLNPRGMVFGPKASLDVRGSFYGSTADEIRFEDGSTFRADPGTTSTLTVAPPVAFGFLGGNPRPTGPITLNGSNLAVPAGETLALVGGPIAMADGRLQAPGGTLHVTSVASGDAALNVPLPAVGPAGDTMVQPENRLGDITLSNDAFLNTSGNGGGRIVIRGGTLRMDRSVMTADNFSDVDSPGRGIDIGVTNAIELKNRSTVSTVAVRAGRAGDVVVRADAAVTVENSSMTTSSSAAGGGGSVIVEAPRVDLTNNASIGTSTLQSSRGGDVRITAEAVTLTRNASLRSSSGPGGLAGDILIDAKGVVISDEASLAGQTGIFSSGQEGHIRIAADDVALANGIIRSSSATADRGGTVTIQAQRVALTQGASVTTTANNGSTGGDIQIAAEDLTLDNARLASLASAGARAGTIALTGQSIAIVDRAADAVQAGIFSEGHAGHINIAADAIAIANGVVVARGTPAGRGGDVTVRTSRLDLVDGASINTGSSQQAPVGDVIVQVDDVMLENASIFSRSDLSPGNVRIEAKGSIGILERAGSNIEAGVFSFGGQELDTAFGQVEIKAPRLTMDGGTIGTPSRLSISVRAGNVNVNVGQLTLQGQALINTSTSSAQDAGMVKIQATDAALTNGATISAETTGSGNAGQIEIAVDRALVLSEASRITSSTTGEGEAGSIDITADELALRANSEITTEGLQADGGNITIQGRRVLLQDSAIRTTTDRGGSGGNIDIATTGGVVALVGSDVETRADIGMGGNITMGALLVDTGSRVDASGGVDDGEVELGTVVNLGAVTPLPQTFAADAPLFNEPCAQRLRGGQVSSFVLAGRAGLPADPSSALPMPMIEEMEGKGDRVAGGYGPVRPLALGRAARGEGDVDAWLQAVPAHPCARRPSDKTAAQSLP